MGVDLKLLVYASESEHCFLSVTALALNRNSAFFAEIRKLNSVDVGKEFHAPGFETNEHTQYIRAGYLAALSGLIDKKNWENRAAFAYLKKVPKEVKVALYWL